MQTAEKTTKPVRYVKSVSTSLLALIIMVIAGVMFTGKTSGTGLWHGVIIGNFARSILGVSEWLNNNYGFGIIVFTFLIRLLILPLMVYQTESMKKMQEIQPAIKRLQEKYPNRRDTTQVQAMQAETSALYKEAGVNPFASFLPLLIQMPVLIALYQSIINTKVLQSGSFFWVQLGQHDQFFILPILAALFTFASSYLVMLGQPEKNTMSTTMTYAMPVMIFFFAISVPSALSLYWVVSNAFQVAQTWTIQNPFKIRRERQAKKAAQKARERAIQKAKRSKKR
ncbi:MAG: YidC/Oxa1 family membrane protein insertase [Lactobacillaceae bacterium]|nr:YidC/Oxa1 family membrane protein insertase [Lactobacillaceae bacterium]